MAADLREMQENQGLSEKQIDKSRFGDIPTNVYMASCFRVPKQVLFPLPSPQFPSVN